MKPSERYWSVIILLNFALPQILSQINKPKYNNQQYANEEYLGSSAKKSKHVQINSNQDIPPTEHSAKNNSQFNYRNIEIPAQNRDLPSFIALNSEINERPTTVLPPARYPKKINYTAIHPPFIYPNQVFKIALFLQPDPTIRNQSYKVSATLKSVTQTLESPKKTIEPGSNGVLEIAVGDVSHDVYNLTLRIGRRVEKVTIIKSDRNSLILIQTDKPVYKPKDTVKYRVLLLDRFSRPVEGAVNIKIFDAKSNLIKLSRNVTPKITGYFRDNLQLSHEPNLGKWKIEVETKNSGKYGSAHAEPIKKTLSFQVLKYTLPKFDVEVELPEYKVYSELKNSPIRVSVLARYIHGKGVQGTCKVEVHLVRTSCKKGREEFPIQSANFLIDGSGVTDMDVSPNKKIEKQGANLVFRVTVMENATGTVVEKEKSIKLYFYPYKILPVEKIKYHRHGLPYLVDFHIVDNSNQLLSDVNENVTVEHDFAGDSHKEIQPIVQGVLRLNYTDSPDGSHENFIQFTYKEITYRYVTPERNGNNRKVLKSLDSLIVERIQSNNVTEIQPGSYVTIRVQVTRKPEIINLLLISENQILMAESRALGEPVGFQVPENTPADATLFVFTYIEGKYVGDSITLKIAKASQDPISVTLSKENLQPGENLTLTIKSSPGSLVALRCIDESVLLLSTDNDISKQVFKDESIRALPDRTNKTSYVDLKSTGMVIESNFAVEESSSKIDINVRNPLEEICTSLRGEAGESSQSNTMDNISAIVEINNNPRNSNDPDLDIQLLQTMEAEGIHCPPNSVTPVKFRVKPLKFGEFALHIKATSGVLVDALAKNLRVTPSGKKVRVRKLIDLKSSSEGTTRGVLGIDFPVQERIPDTNAVEISLISDNMGNVPLENFEKLIELPVGCGEQNMLAFVANLAILTYLDASGGLSPTIKEKTKKYLEIGYQRELIFKHEDGSFSAFGKSDTNGSTWLTAFVIRNFLIARKYIEIDNSVIRQGLKFLIAQQSPEGMFTENGQVFDVTIQDELGSNGTALAAFCLLTLIKDDTGFIADEYKTKTSDFLWFRFNKMENRTRQNMYSLVLLTHAETELNPTSPDLSKYLKKLETFLSEPDGVTKFWQTADVKGDVSKASPALDIEMASYVLLTYLQKEDMTSAIPIVDWLAKQQNENGGFVSTRDTAVALQALAKYASRTRSDGLDLEVDILAINSRTDNLRRVGRGVRVTKDISKLLQTFPIHGEYDMVTFSVRGLDGLRAYVTWTYYVTRDDPTSSNSFSINIYPEVTNTTGTLGLRVCARNLQDEKSNMAIIEVTLPSGYTFKPQDPEQNAINGTYKREEVSNDGTKIEMYFEYILKTQETCSKIWVQETFRVQRASGPMVIARVYDYYEPSKKVEISVKLKG
ncbi:unnamed protein product [Allacma fusca]|uniref:Uncharacterized protein n=1 Tax=Allacma fusca TaxID=39272 RepID=A0A8J2KH90_9HEXA|nr:unnamed protein product [Allacma fusca]